MAIWLTKKPASGGPGIEPRWTRSDKDGVGTAYSALSRVWFTVSKGILNEVYYPTIDRPQIRDLQFFALAGGPMLNKAAAESKDLSGRAPEYFGELANI